MRQASQVLAQTRKTRMRLRSLKFQWERLWKRCLFPRLPLGPHLSSASLRRQTICAQQVLSKKRGCSLSAETRNSRLTIQAYTLFLGDLHPELAHFAIEVGTMQAETFRRIGHVSSRPVDVTLDVRNLEFASRIRERFVAIEQ